MYLFEKIISIGPEHIPAYRDLRLRGLREHPEAFGETAQAFEAKSLHVISERVAAQVALGGFILGAISTSGAMLGCVGLSVNDSAKSRHRGFLWGMYVVPEARGQQLGRVLLEELIARARMLEFMEQVHLAVVTSNETAVRLYQRVGFEIYGTDPRVLKVDGRYFDEYLMVRQMGKLS
jgi:ribosomal protein S18 acetylase RimI-like enzyme